MKDKEKQIEEITNVICESCKGRMGFCFHTKEPCEQVIEDATALYNTGYRKIDKDSVVLSKEEYQDLKEYKNIAEQRKFNLDYANVELRRLEFELKQAVKETAEKFYDKICTNTCVFTTPPNVNEDYNKGYVQAMADHSERIDELAKQFGVEIKE